MADTLSHLRQIRVDVIEGSISFHVHTQVEKTLGFGEVDVVVRGEGHEKNLRQNRTFGFVGSSGSDMSALKAHRKPNHVIATPATNDNTP